MKKRIHWATNKSFYVETALFLIVNSGTSGLVLSYHVAAFSCTTLVTTLIFLNLLCNENHLNSFNFKFKKRRLTMKATQDLLLWLINFCFLDKKIIWKSHRVIRVSSDHDCIKKVIKNTALVF